MYLLPYQTKIVIYNDLTIDPGCGDSSLNIREVKDMAISIMRSESICQQDQQKNGWSRIAADAFPCLIPLQTWMWWVSTLLVDSVTGSTESTREGKVEEQLVLLKG